ncbi:uncharacterized protein LOC110844392 [Folsomia candida]|uniref:Uncharacterized protein n=1 Tax=Folsomia candida TaxID=158441 RepID=A0A226EP19_FOLCA|nr:uncharacterized protein LOC110844392 [Folsomia candida]OXA59030.1 hypothetical protein Fcan01_05520 [Folsomia candida]
MKTLGNKFTVIFIILFCGSGVLLSQEASAEAPNGTNNEKYSDIIPKGIDPMDTFAYSLLIEHLKRPPSRISTDGKPIEHGYYVIDTHRKADGSPIHFERNDFSGGLTDQVLPPLQSSKSEYSAGGGGVASTYQQSTDQNVASSFHEEIKLSSGNTRDLSNISLTSTTEPPLPHLAQDVHPPNVNSTSEYQQSHNQQQTHDHGSVSSQTTTTSAPVDAPNPVESSYQKHPNFPQLHTLSEQLKFLSESLKQLQLLSRPGVGASEQQQSHPHVSQSIINHQNTTSQEPPNLQQQQVTPAHTSNSDLGVSSTVPTIGYQTSQSSEPQMRLPEDLGTHIMTLHKTNVPSTDSPLPSPQASPGPNELEHGIPTNLNEEMDLLEASLRNQEYSQSQGSPGSAPNVHETTNSPPPSHLQQNYHNLHHHANLKPTVVDKVITNGLISAHNLPVKYHHSVSHKIPGQQVPVNNHPGFVPNSAQPYYDHSQYDNNSPVIFKNQHFSIQGSPLAQTHYFKTGSHHQEQTNYEGNSYQQEQQTPITTNKYFQPNIISRPPLQINAHSHFPIISRDNTIQKAVEILNNYSDAFLENIILTEQQQQHKKVKQQPTPNNFHVPVVTSTSPPTTPVTTRSPIQNSQIKIQPFSESGVDYPQTISATTSIPLIRQPSPTPQQINVQQQQTFEQYSPKNVQTDSQFSEQNTRPYSDKIQFKPAYARVILRNGQQQHGLSSQLSENIESSSSITNKYSFPNSPPSPPNRPPLHHYPSDGTIIKSNSILKPQFSAPDMLFQNTRQIEQVLKSAVLPTPKASSQSSAKYSTIFIRPQVGGGSSSSESWKTASSEVQSRIPSTNAEPLNHEGFKSFGKIF